MKVKRACWAKTVRDVLAEMGAKDYSSGGHQRSRFVRSVEGYGDVYVIVWRLTWWNVVIIDGENMMQKCLFRTDEDLIRWLALW